MKAQKVIFAVAVLFSIGLATSCTKPDLAEEENLIDATEEVQAIDGKEIKEGDT